MKASRLGFLTVALAGAFLASSLAFAGFQTGQSVVIADSSRLANGDLGYVHNSPDPNQLIGCEVYHFGGTPAGYCYASNGPLYRTCYTTNPNMIATIRSVKDDSYLVFYWDASGYCSFVEVENDSTTAPKK